MLNTASDKTAYMSREGVVKTPFEELRESRVRMGYLFSKGDLSDGLQESYTEITDQYFRRSLQESDTGRKLFRKKTPFALVALGGYGRKELCLGSDIDIMILFGTKIPDEAKELAKEILFPLWDLGLDLGYGIRNISDCIGLSKDDFEVLTSLMDARFICGDSPLYLLLMETLDKKVVGKKATAFGRWLDDRNNIRMHTLGDASYLLEPDLKDGIGGLRDYHHMLWLARTYYNLRAPRDLEYLGILSHSEYRELRTHLGFIWLVRNHLHQLSGRRNDRLVFEYQERIAEKLGFKDKKGFLGVEQFMGRLHASMAVIKSLHRSFVISQVFKPRGDKKKSRSGEVSKGLHLDQGEINFNSATQIVSKPQLMMDIFAHGARLKCPLSMEAKRLVREFLHLVDESFRTSKGAVQSFLGILNSDYTFEALDQMHETRFLEAFIPEFSRIRDRVQFNSYHIYPVGRHAIQTVRNLKSLPQEKEMLLLDIFSEIPDPETLYLAGLLHDIGKFGNDHSQRGAVIARRALKRFAYVTERVEDVVFLVKHHLLLAKTATRRDLNDEKVIVQCAQQIGDLRRLKMLYLLTWADSKATGPRAWSDWIASLVQELFVKILHVLTAGELASPDISRKAKRTKAQVLKEVGERIHATQLEGMFDSMPPRYLKNSPPRNIVRHLDMVQELNKRIKEASGRPFILEAVEDEPQACWKLTFLAKDRPGLFSDLAGVLALNNINILSAEIYTWRDGTALDLFNVTSPLDPIHPERTWKRVEHDLEKTFRGKLSLSYRLGQKSAPSILSSSKKPTHPPLIKVDNDSSDFSTLIEVFADDRVGLLYTITHTLFNLRLDISVAKIATQVDQSADVFYVRDWEGQKIVDEEQVAEIKHALAHALQGG
jgi:[protein-PII] uridylyltransferase